jgi:hypothetical protein
MTLWLFSLGLTVGTGAVALLCLILRPLRGERFAASTFVWLLTAWTILLTLACVLAYREVYATTLQGKSADWL